MFFPSVEGIDVRDAGRTAEVTLATKVEGELVTVTIRLSYGQAAGCGDRASSKRCSVTVTHRLTRPPRWMSRFELLQKAKTTAGLRR